MGGSAGQVVRDGLSYICPHLLDALAKLFGGEMPVLFGKHFAGSSFAGGDQVLIFDGHFVASWHEFARDVDQVFLGDALAGAIAGEPPGPDQHAFYIGS